MSKSVYYDKPLKRDDTAIEVAFKKKVEQHSEEGFGSFTIVCNMKENLGIISEYIGFINH